MRWLYGGVAAAGLLLVAGGWLTARVVGPEQDEANIGAGLIVAVGYLLVLIGVLAAMLSRVSRVVRERRFARRDRPR